MNDKIAVIGIGCIFPDAPDFTEYWRNIVEGKNSVRDLSGEFWEEADFYDPDPRAQDKFYTKTGAIVDPVEFDSMEFGISPKVMQSTSTEQLFALIAARQALIDAGLYGKNARPFNKEKTGVIISSPTGKNAFELSHRSEAPKIRTILVNNGIPEDVADRVVEKYKASLSDWTEDNNPGYIPNVVAGRIANRFDLGGTSCSVDAACASSLASIKFAVSELQSGNCDVMLAGGASLDASVTAFVSFCKTPAMSKKGTITPFDASADGMILGDGVGIVVLKRLEDARRDGDKIYAVVRGVGTSGDGRAKSIYAPSKEGQKRALRRAYENSGVSPDTIGLIEAHGTGTAAGDACEISAISEVYQNEKGGRDTVIGSVKSQIGHLRMSAGVAGFIKAALALHEKVLPASINMTVPNPVLVDSNLCVLSKPKAWIVNGERPVRRAAVSSFGFGGTNYHVVLEEADSDYTDAYRVTPAPMGVMFSAKTKEELIASVKALSDFMESDARAWYKDEYRYHKYPENYARLAFVAKSADEVKEKCAKALALLGKNASDAWVQSDIAYSARPVDKTAKIAALFSGQGTQELDMLSEIAMAYPEMRAAITEADNVMLSENGTPVSKTVYPNLLTEEEKTAAKEALRQTKNTQPALAAIEAGLYSVVKNRGFAPDIMIGHSFGELVALWADGVWDYGTLVRAAKERGSYMGQVTGDTAMTAVMADKAAVSEYIKGLENIYLANENSPSQTVVSGGREDVEKLEKILSEAGVKAVRLNVSGAFHSPYMAEAAEKFRAFLDTAEIGASSGRVIANCDGKAYGGRDTVADTLKKQLTDPVLFRTSIENAYGQGARVFVEIGNGKVLSGLTKNILEGREHTVITLCPDKNKDSTVQLEFAMAQLAVIGADIKDDKYRVLPNEEITVKKKKTSYSVNEEAFVLPAEKKAKEDALKPDPEMIKKNRESMAAALAKAGIAVNAPEKEAKTVKEEVRPTVIKEEKTAEPKGALNTVKEPNITGHNGISDISAVQKLNADVFAKFMDVQTSQMEAVTNMLKASGSKTQDEKKDIMDCIGMFQNNSLKAFQTYFSNQTGAEVSYGEAYVPETPAPVIETPASVVEAPVPVIEKAAPAVEAPAPVIEKPTPAVEAPVPVIEKPTPAVEAPVPVAEAAAPTETKSGIVDTVLEIVSEKTGYPTDMIDMDMELETDLGIDSIKRVEILSDVNKKMGDIFTADDVTNLSTKGTISGIVGYLETLGGTPKTETAPVAAVSAETKSGIADTVLEIVSEKTGYPTDMIDMDMELETDLGIDSIKRVEILSDVNKKMGGIFTADDVTSLSTKGTISGIVGYLETLGGAPKTETAPAEKDGGASSGLIEKTVLESISEKTGYPTDMIDSDMELETDLGIDSIKRVEIFSAVIASLGCKLTAEEVSELSGLPDIKSIVAYFTEKI